MNSSQDKKQKKSIDKPVSTGNQQETRDEKGRFIEGVSGNPAGRPQGSLDFKTKWFRFIDKVAAQNKLTTDEVDEQLLATAFKRAKEGDYPFYRDVQDRIFGKVKETLDVGASDDLKEFLLKLNKVLDD